MQDAITSLQSMAARIPCNDHPTSISQLHIFTSVSKYSGPRYARRRLFTTNGRPQGREHSKEIRLDEQDLMAIEFGRLLGESREQTVTKVLRKKLDPNSTYIKLEKEARDAKELIKKSGFTSKAGAPEGTSRNESGFSLNVPHLGAHPRKQNTGPFNFSSSSKKESFNDSLLRKPVSPQSSQSVSAIVSSNSLKTNKTEDVNLQHIKAVDLRKLRRPSLDNGSNALTKGTAAYHLKLDSNAVSQEIMNRGSKEKPKGERASDVLTSATSFSEKGFDLPIEFMPRDDPQQVDAAAALPNLASPPSRHHNSIATSSYPASKGNQAIDHLIKNPPNELLDEIVLQNSVVHSGSGDQFSSVGASAIPQLAAPPPRHQGLIGKFIQPKRSSFKSSEDNSVDESLIRRPIVAEKAADSTAGTTQSKHISMPLSSSKHLEGREKFLDASVLPTNPQKVALPSEFNSKTNHEGDSLKQCAIEETSQGSPSWNKTQMTDFQTSTQKNSLTDSTSDVKFEIDSGKFSDMECISGAGDKSSDFVLEIEDPSQPHKQPPESRTSDELKDVRERHDKSVSTREVDMAEDASSAVNKGTLTAMKRPARILSLELAEDFSLERGYREEIIDTSSRQTDLVSEANMSSSMPNEATFGQSGREQEGQVTMAAGTNQTKSINFIQRPSQHVNITPHPSKISASEASKSNFHQAEEEEEKDWAQAEALLKAREQIEVKIIGNSSSGLVVSLGCLVGSIPSFELSPNRGVVDFGSWAQQKGYALTQGKLMKVTIDGGLSNATQNVEEVMLSPGTEADINGLRTRYHDETSKLLASFVGERTKVIIKLLDKERRKLRVSEKEAAPGYHQHLQKKANLMAELKLGEVVTCQVKSITSIGVFVEVDGVAALIHHSELSWNSRVDPASLLSIGEVIKAKVCRLDRSLQRINLSLKQMQPDPLKRTLESVIEDVDTNNSPCKIEASVALKENWPELEDIVKKLEQMDHVSSVSKGRCLYSAAFAPSFQVLISIPQCNGYKLLARFGNKIQEILVDTTLDREKMKECIRLCTFTKAEVPF